MARQPSETTIARNAAINQYVQWHMNRGNATEGIYESAKEKFGGRYWRAIQGSINFIASVQTAGDKLDRARATSKINLDTIPTRSGNPTSLRLNLDVNFGSGLRTKGGNRFLNNFSIDIGPVKTKGQLMDAIFKKLVDVLSSKYESRSRDIGKQIADINIVGVEAI